MGSEFSSLSMRMSVFSRLSIIVPGIPRFEWHSSLRRAPQLPCHRVLRRGRRERRQSAPGAQVPLIMIRAVTLAGSGAGPDDGGPPSVISIGVTSRRGPCGGDVPNYGDNCALVDTSPARCSRISRYKYGVPGYPGYRRSRRSQHNVSPIESEEC
jgi:hypothetical protein